MLNRGSSLSVCLGLLAAAAGFGQQYQIATLAGNGTAGYADGTDFTAVQFNLPNAVTVDSKGAIYIADTTGARIRLISGGSVSTIAGTGNNNPYSATAGTATSANINAPAGIAVASDGTVYIAESANHVVRKISGGTLSVYAGTSLYGYSGDGGQANVAQLYGPTGLALDAAGNLYIADTLNNLIRRVDKSTLNITSYVGGTGPTAGSLKNPTGIAFDASGALYIADSDHNRIAKFVPNANPQLTTFAGNGNVGSGGDGGPALKAQLNHPVGLAFDAAGALYIADVNNSRIRKIGADGNIYTIAGSGSTGYWGDGGKATDAALNFPRGVAVGSDGTVYIADTANSVIRSLTPKVAVAAGVGNAASGLARISPGALASMYGTGFGDTTAQADIGLVSNALPTTLNNVSVLVNGTAAPLLYLSPGQINFQVPWKTTANSSGTAAVSVLINGGASNVVQVPWQTAAPGLFTYNGGSAIVQNQDYTLNDAGHPAAVGSTIVAYLTGSGPVSPAAADGTPTPNSPLTNITASKSAKIGGFDASVSFAGLSPGFVGLVQFNIVVPSGLSPGTYPLVVTIDGQASNSGTIVVK